MSSSSVTRSSNKATTSSSSSMAPSSLRVIVARRTSLPELANSTPVLHNLMTVPVGIKRVYDDEEASCSVPSTPASYSESPRTMNQSINQSINQAHVYACGGRQDKMPVKDLLNQAADWAHKNAARLNSMAVV